MRTQFDHVEVHVDDILKYCTFLTCLFEGGATEVISQTGTSMFTSPDGIHIEVKKKKNSEAAIQSGFCNPCVKRKNAHEFIDKLGLVVESVRETPAGPVFFFRDHENILWHIKDLPHEYTP
ncbi:MAG: hypothetical protein COV43_00660 [Deltaproteobacteria bacterium CG11_big_fil_rev_8_21_14_0_20_42_23]|nr:MAG: hypothetical protein COV43_00660 [Deltaproteobacteria bacterium CG11_big_fil_rev_8_21_14_0_20_42_23]PJC64531.1 MAG: hypothetical protein CO021_03645 [Deltaproteobacteria bacterium CG_4_9_14_0_2_um_filter_42_21]